MQTIKLLICVLIFIFSTISTQGPHNVSGSENMTESASALISENATLDYQEQIIVDNKSGIYSDKSNTTINIDDINRTDMLDYVEIVEVYAIDPSEINFANTAVAAAAKGSELWKCKDWNFSEQRCYGTWLKVMDIIPDERYSFVMTSEYPAFAESAEILDAWSYSSIGGNWALRVNATSIAGLDIYVKVRNIRNENINFISSAANFDFKNKKIEKYKIKLNNYSIKEIEFNNLSISRKGDLKIDDVLETGEFKNFVEIYAIDPRELNFTNATVKAVAKGTELYKCREWNFTEQKCYGTWTKIMDITPGQNYTFTLTPEDPGYGEILITKALHLDENRELISDIYNEVKALDGIWSEPIYHTEYIRVTFSQNLTSANDITIYARNTQDLNTSVEVYYFNSTEKITEFPIINKTKYYKVYLTGLSGSSDTFDLKIKDYENDSSAYLEFDHIVDPTAILRPNDDGTNSDWDGLNTIGYQAVDEPDSEPSDPGDGTFRMANKNHDYLSDEYQMTTQSGVGTVTQIVLWMRAYTESAAVQPTANIYLGSWQTLQNCNWATSESWTSLTWGGLSGSQTDLDNLQVRLTAGKTGPTSEHYVDTVYVVVTYNSPPNTPTLNSPDSGTLIDTNWTLLNWTCTDPDGDNMTAYVYGDNTTNPSTPINTTYDTISGTSYTYNWTGLNDTTYYWKVTCNDSSLANTSAIYTFTVDTGPPVIAIVYPWNNTNISAGTTWTWVNISTNENAVCRYNLTNSTFNYTTQGTNFTTTGGTSHSFNYSGLSDGQAYNLYYKCNDTIGYINTESTYHTFGVRTCNCSSCGDCGTKFDYSECGTVYLTTSIESNGTCIDLSVDYKIFDCQGYTIDGNGTGYGVNISSLSPENITVKNCIIIDFERGIYADPAEQNDTEGWWRDSFGNADNISEMKNVNVSNGNVTINITHYYIVNQDTNTNSDWGFFPPYKEGQSFNHTSTDPLTKIAVYIRRFGTPGSLIVEIQGHDSTNNEPNGTILVNKTIPYGDVPTNSEWFEVDLEDTYLTKDEYYWLVLYTNSGADGSNFYRWPCDESNPYADGFLAEWGGSSWTDYSGSDEQFRIYAAANKGNITSTTIIPSLLTNWDEFYANDNISGSGTNITYKLLNASNNATLCTITEADAGAGYDISICADGVASIRLFANLTTTNTLNTPVLMNWNVSWIPEKSSSNLNFTNNTISNCTYGIYFQDIDNSTIENNNVSSNNYGIYLNSSSNNTLTDNTANNSQYHGLYIDSISADNTINSNTFCLNNQSGGAYYDIYDADANSGDNNTCYTNYNWNDTGQSGCRYSCGTTPPTIYLMTPANNSNTADNTTDFTFNATDDFATIVNCTLYINDTAYGTNDSVQNNTETTITSNPALDDGIYSWWINCTDTAGNENKSEVRTITIDMWHIFFGNVSGNITLRNSGVNNAYLWDVAGIKGNVYAVSNQSIDWSMLYALGKNTTNGNASNDFTEADTNLGVSDHSTDINNTFSIDGSDPKETTWFEVFGRNITNVPIANSTNSTNFVTGILWDAESDGDGEYDTTENENLVFVTKMNENTQGKYGVYDYEIRLPYTLDTYKGEGAVYFYVELK